MAGVICVIENVGGDHPTDSNIVYVEDMHKHFKSLLDIGDFVGGRLDLKQLTIDYGEKQGTKTTAEERFLIESFVNGNKNKKDMI